MARCVRAYPLILATALAVAAALPSAAAAAGWSAPATVVGSTYHFVSRPAVDAAGDTFVVYTDGTSGGHIWLAKRPAGGVFGSPMLIAPTDSFGQPVLASDAAGDLVIAWMSGYKAPGHTHYNLDPYAATVSSAGVLAYSGTPLVDPPGDGVQNQVPLTIASNASGAAAIAWATPASPHSQIQVVTRADATQQPGNLTTLGATGPGNSDLSGFSAITPAVSVDDAGNVVLVYSQAGGVLENNAYGSQWQSAPIKLSTGASAGDPAVASAGTNTLVSWIDLSGAYSVRASLAMGATPANVPLSAEKTLSSGANVDALAPTIALDAAGDAVVVWQEVGFVRASVRQGPTGPFTLAQSEIHVSDEPFNQFPTAAAMLPGGPALIAWQDAPTNGSYYIDEARTLSTAGLLGPTSTIAQGTSGADVASTAGVDGFGEPVFLWEMSLGTAVQVAGYDTAGPQLAAPSVPAGAVAGAAVGMSIAMPLDVWSSVGAVTWSFGDGATAGGLAVSHTYASAGTYTVTVSATDTVGNASSRSAQITVTAPPPPPPLSCLVPSLSHLSLKTAKSRLAGAHCALGKQRKARRPRRTRGLSYGVVSQSPRAGTSRSAGSEVDVTLGWFKPPKPKRHKHK